MISSTTLKRLYIILKSEWIKSFLKGNKISFSSFEILTNTKKVVTQINTIIDVGANQGQFQKAARYFYPNARIISFEPIPELFENLQKSKDQNIKNYNYGLGASESVLEFNKNEYSHSSSFLDVKEGNDNFPSTDTKKIGVQVKTLDGMLNELNLGSNTLLKIDVQGFETQVLKGAKDALQNHVTYVIVECNFEELYQGQPSFTELNNVLNDFGFELKTLLDFNLGKENQYIEADFLYVKK